MTPAQMDVLREIDGETGLRARRAEARRRADLVLVSVHSHEPGPTPETPGEFLREFAHRMIDEGADIVVGHGPHQLRGVELHRGKPIFYSLGNIVSQIELADRVPAEDYAKIPAREQLTPGGYFAELSAHGRRMFAPHRRYRQSLVPVLTFDDGALVDARLHPVDLGFGRPVHHRGRPRLADPVEAKEILTDLARLAEPYGAAVTAARGEDPKSL
ncbi:CapA family protein [Streptomyces sp. NPDC002643]